MLNWVPPLLVTMQVVKHTHNGPASKSMYAFAVNNNFEKKKSKSHFHASKLPTHYISFVRQTQLPVSFYKRPNRAQNCLVIQELMDRMRKQIKKIIIIVEGNQV